MILTKTKGLAMVYYITNYATKPDTTPTLPTPASSRTQNGPRRQSLWGKEGEPFYTWTRTPTAAMFYETYDSDCDGWIQKLRRPDEYAIPIFQGYISDDVEDDHPVYVKRNSVLHLALFSAEDARQDAKLWASRSEGDDTVDVEYPLDDGQYEEPPATAQHHQAYTALLQILQNAVQDGEATKDSSVLGGLMRDLCEENPAEERQPFVQRQEDLYRNIPPGRGDALCQFPISRDDVQAAEKAQQLLHLRMLDDIESGSQETLLSTDGADIDDTLARYGDMGPAIAHPGSDLNERGPRMLVDASPATSFADMGLATAATFTLNYLQTMALQLYTGGRVARESRGSSMP
ncbi:uncharacterized protein HRG_06692 [Hirsutella rhossiliensis]|uniref:Uncharacterized protein n=1 Tax=Hirsutella rhossiliensis TaxID=111463 RepID=A0A9P8MWJ9_9HYPO|nr:uncharacterized protein HRG_06692 [Hirsutella rhossiliensis]KAH0962590.1 hypothetical protein HRG_06692 [Hirsutella rhossiliensis]